MKIGVIRGQKQSDKRKSAGVSTLLWSNWLKNCVCKVIFLLSSYSVRRDVTRRDVSKRKKPLHTVHVAENDLVKMAR